jgi:hypothetical protein
MDPDLTIFGHLNLNLMLKIEFEKIGVRNRYIQDIKGCHNHLCSFSNSSIKKSYDSYIVSPIIFANGLPN